MVTKHFTNLSDYHSYMGWPQNVHPSVSVISFEKDGPNFTDPRLVSPPISSDFYVVKILHNQPNSDFSYGVSTYDFQKGFLAYFSPCQVHAWEVSELPKSGFVLNIHKDYVRGFDIEKKLQSCPFFSYNSNEALFLTSSEEFKITSLFESIKSEYIDNSDGYTQSIIHSLVTSILTYTQRFYDRQFAHRKTTEKSISEKVITELHAYQLSGELKRSGLPTTEFFSEKISVSPRYLCEALKYETGKTTQEIINNYIVEQAKNLLLTPGITVSEVAYQLGFTYPQYFSRMFKSKVGVSPKNFRASLNN